MMKKALAAALLLCLGLALPASAEVIKQEAQIASLDMVWPQVKTKNKKADMAINKDIRRFMDDFRGAYVDRKFVAGKTWYETKYEDNQLVSIVMSDLRTQNGGAGLAKTAGMVYYKATGERLPLASFVRVTVDDLNGLLNSRFYRDGDVKIVPSKKVTRVPEDYFLNPDGSISILFQQDEISSLLDGVVYCRLSPQEVRELNEKNPKQ